MFRISFFSLLCLMFPLHAFDDDVYKITSGSSIEQLDISGVKVDKDIPYYHGKKFTYVYQHVIRSPFGGKALSGMSKSWVYIGKKYIDEIRKVFKDADLSGLITCDMIKKWQSMQSFAALTKRDQSAHNVVLSSYSIQVIADVLSDFKGRSLNDMLCALNINNIDRTAISAETTISRAKVVNVQQDDDLKPLNRLLLVAGLDSVGENKSNAGPTLAVNGDIRCH